MLSSFLVFLVSYAPFQADVLFFPPPFALFSSSFCSFSFPFSFNCSRTSISVTHCAFAFKPCLFLRGVLGFGRERLSLNVLVVVVVVVALPQCVEHTLLLLALHSGGWVLPLQLEDIPPLPPGARDLGTDLG